MNCNLSTSPVIKMASHRCFKQLSEFVAAMCTEMNINEELILNKFKYTRYARVSH